MLHVEDFVIDVGSGAGFPGIIMSIYGFKNVVLFEKNFKKSVFLNTIKARLGLGFEVVNEDIYNFSKIKNVPRGTFRDFVMVSRAFGKLSQLLEIMLQIKADKGIFHKGTQYKEEIIKSSEVFDYKFETQASVTNSSSVIITVYEVRRK
jgi:16S rRNA (guanine527-N7)-methyltransferase